MRSMQAFVQCGRISSYVSFIVIYMGTEGSYTRVRNMFYPKI